MVECLERRAHLQQQVTVLENQLAQTQSLASELQVQLAHADSEKQQIEQALKGAHAEVQSLQAALGSACSRSTLCVVNKCTCSSSQSQAANDGAHVPSTPPETGVQALTDQCPRGSHADLQKLTPALGLSFVRIADALIANQCLYL